MYVMVVFKLFFIKCLKIGFKLERKNFGERKCNENIWFLGGVWEIF